MSKTFKYLYNINNINICNSIKDRNNIKKIHNRNNIRGMAKKIMSVTIDDGVFEKWRVHTQEGCINSSKLIEKLMEEHLKKAAKK